MTQALTTRAGLSLSESLSYLQRYYFIAKLGGEVNYGLFKDLEVMRSDEFNQRSINFYNRSNIALLMQRDLFNQGVNTGDAREAIAVFMVDPQTVVFSNMGFYPPGSDIPEHTLNLYQPPRVCGQPGSESKRITEYILEVICDGNYVLFNYFMQWLAHALRRPHEKPGVMIVLIGEQGVGKGLLLALLRRIFGPTAWQTSSINHVVGRFNAWLEGVMIVMLDEALFEGDKKSHDIMKSLITEAMITVEQKNRPVMQMPSFHRYIAATNHKVFSKIEISDRRHAYFHVSSKYKGDKKYFSALFGLISDDIEVAKFVNQLYEVDLSDFSPGIAPKSQLRDEQVVQSLEGFEAFWYQCLLNGFEEMAESFFSDEDFKWTEAKGGFVSAAKLLSEYNHWLTGHKRYKHLNYRDIKDHISNYVGDCSARGKMRGYNLPGLVVLRERFESTLGLASVLDWCD
jgi:hypothetical protein